MDYSTWLSSASLDVTNNNSNTLRLFDDAPVKDVKTVKVDNNPPPPTTTTSSNDTGALLEELNRVNAENKRLTEMLTVVCENYNDLKRQLREYMNKSSSNNEANKKRKLENTSNNGVNTNTNVNANNAIVVRNNNESSSSDEEDSYEKQKEETIKAKITRVAVRTEASDSSLILKDGYQWRKYGQKVTRDNPCPRAYFKCSFAPSCPVKKKVQRSLEDQSMLVATYEGDHNHPAPVQPEGATPSGASRTLGLGSGSCNGSAPTVTLDLTKPKSNVNNDSNNTTTNTSNNNNINKNMLNNINNNTSSNQVPKFSSPEFQKILAEQMASSLTKDPNFTAALAAAISGRFGQQSSSD
ncbi:putative WRKY transcription factor 40 [Bienertia sinuspersici]